MGMPRLTTGASALPKGIFVKRQAAGGDLVNSSARRPTPGKRAWQRVLRARNLTDGIGLPLTRKHHDIDDVIVEYLRDHRGMFALAVDLGRGLHQHSQTDRWNEIGL